MTKKIIIITITIAIIAILGGLANIMRQNYDIEKVSQFGQYFGYSVPYFDGHIRKSDFLVLSDGTKLAYDLLLPTKNDIVTSDSLPVLFCFSTYLRAFNMIDEGKVINNEIMNLGVVEKAFIWLRAKFQKDGHIFDYAMIDPWTKRMLQHGYAVIIVEQRGTGASKGFVNPSLRSMSEDANEVLNWIAKQEWSNGKIGMFGKSSLAISQYAAAAANNPHLKAIFPVSSSFDLYDGLIYPGGILNIAFTDIFELSTKILENMIVSVDKDIEPRDKTETFSYKMTKIFRESYLRDYNEEIWRDLNLYTMLDEINKSGVAIYNATGWRDIFTRDAILWHNNLTVPRKMYISNTDHYTVGNKESGGLDMGAEAHRWFDYWLKGIDNGIMKEPSIHFYVIGEGWRSATEFPDESIEKRRFYFDVDSQNNGLLTIQKPQSLKAHDLYIADYSATSGKKSRWNSVIEPADYSNISFNEANVLKYTTLPFAEDMEIIGHPVVSLFVSTEEEDLDFFVYLVKVDNDGKLTYLTEGHLRASHRKIAEAPFYNLNLPFQSGLRGDVQLLSSTEIAELVFDLLPIANKIPKGSRISLIVALADYDNFKTPIIEPAPKVKILRNSINASFIDIPIYAWSKGGGK